jgi:hypothetical protein
VEMTDGRCGSAMMTFLERLSWIRGFRS